MSNPAVQPLCPECGTPARSLPLRKPHHLRLAQLLPLAALLLALVWVAHRNYANWPPLPPSIPLAANILTVEFPDHRFTRADLEAIARGTDDHPPLIPPRFTDFPIIFPERELTATFHPPAGDQQRFRRYGWPLNLLSYRTTATYEDIYTQHIVTSAPRPRAEQGWLGWAHIEQYPNSRGELVTRVIIPEALAANILMLALAWCAGGLALRILRRTRILRRHSPRLAAAIRLAPVLALLIASIILSLRPHEDRGHRLPPLAWPATAHTGLTAGDILQFHNHGQSSAAIARAVLAAPGLAELPGDDADGVLLLGWQSSAPIAHTHISRGWPIGLLSTSQFTLHEQAHRNPHRRLPVQWEGQTLKYHRLHKNDAGMPLCSITSLSLRAAAIILLLLFIAWTAGLGAASLVHLANLRRQRKRLHANHCLHCAYDRRALTQAPPTSPAPKPPPPP